MRHDSPHPVSPPQLKHKSVRHLDTPGYARFLTFSCYQSRPLLVSDDRCSLLARCLDTAVARHSFGLSGFVFMPDHVHLLVYPRTNTAAVSRLLYGIKKPFAEQAKRLLQAHEPDLLAELTVVERPGKLAFRFWQEGSGYDRSLNSQDAFAQAIEYIHLNPVRAGYCESAWGWRWSSWAAYSQATEQRDEALPVVHGWPFDDVAGSA